MDKWIRLHPEYKNRVGSLIDFQDSQLYQKLSQESGLSLKDEEEPIFGALDLEFERVLNETAWCNASGHTIIKAIVQTKRALWKEMRRELGLLGGRYLEI